MSLSPHTAERWLLRWWLRPVARRLAVDLCEDRKSDELAAEIIRNEALLYWAKARMRGWDPEELADQVLADAVEDRRCSERSIFYEARDAVAAGLGSSGAAIAAIAAARRLDPKPSAGLVRRAINSALRVSKGRGRGRG